MNTAASLSFLVEINQEQVGALFAAVARLDVEIANTAPSSPWLPMLKAERDALRAIPACAVPRRIATPVPAPRLRQPQVVKTRDDSPVQAVVRSDARRAKGVH